jgi:hypothetical protein
MLLLQELVQCDALDFWFGAAGGRHWSSITNASADRVPLVQTTIPACSSLPSIYTAGSDGESEQKAQRTIESFGYVTAACHVCMCETRREGSHKLHHLLRFCEPS